MTTATTGGTAAIAYNIIETSKKIRDLAVNFSSGTAPTSDELTQLDNLMTVLAFNVNELNG